MVLGKVIWVFGLILQIGIRYPYRKGGQNKPDSQERILLAVLAIGGFLIPLVYLLTDLLGFANYDAPFAFVGIGTFLQIAGLWLFWRAHKDLGENWSSTLEVYEGHKLITNGIYKTIRHPMYAANWLMTLAQVFLLPNWIAGLSGILSFALMYFLRVAKEEAMMKQAFGAEYEDYMSKTGRVFPKRP